MSRKGVKTRIKVLRGPGAIDNKGARYLIPREIKADIKIILIIKPLIDECLGDTSTILSLKRLKIAQNLAIIPLNPQIPRGSFGGQPNSAGKGYYGQLENIKFL
ncbi:hypothetical protein NIES298_02120 [Microcystis aeruginosa NIES-298]|uniref:Uncharacterized protein n=5 Tax=Microcystis aeruginosa TaxID=1126 RepID=S3J3F6_MICAE|nr:hypothetical protein BH695_0281 [Microcystis aeruginosa PCC 7806SL]ELP53860.1 hypothetical protein O53_2671 [Microcystis aeruginosa TAIHU98]EPF19246.1 hypothetical protein MAESPC_04118 [Microcystis aeruginosa SPC777]OCY11870.1 MAG: hypothetical protein BEV12_12310 [Microcystis aeruginosa CACIAM 03]CAO91387.1 unnamed protein product [Microcystis aeruginosa PCC 7806]GBD52280.1 hypothetical protein BGM30_13730 [Microcystis aeruginosa NIES-298]